MAKAGIIDARSENKLFSELESLCTSPGYIHAIAYFCWRDNLIKYSGSQVVEKDLEHLYSHKRLLRTEIATLIGLMARQSPIDSSLQAPSVTQDYIDRTEGLLDELHQALMKPWHKRWNLQACEVSDNDPFANAEGLREPIFYDGESAYGFQYRDLALLKYGADNDWLQSQKGFRIDEACQIVEALGRLQSKRQLECAQSLKKQLPDEWTMLPGFMFTVQDAVEASGFSKERVERFLDAFSCGSGEQNTSFTALNEFNITNAAPILKFCGGSYALLQHYSLLEAIYETPIFWMRDDKEYLSTAIDNRGRFTERFVADQLEAIFGTVRVLRNLDVYQGKERVAEFDALVLYGDHAIVVQAKSKRLTIEARKGNDLQLKDDFKRAIQDAYNQALRCAEALTNDGFRFFLPTGVEFTIRDKPKIVFPVCVVSDHYPALALQARQFLKTTVTNSIQAPLVTDVFALDVVTEMLNTPLHFLNYLALRARFYSKLLVSKELTALGFHLSHGLWLNADEYIMVTVGDELAAPVDIAMQARRDGMPGEKTPKGILTRLKNLTVGRLLAEIEKADSPQLTGLGMLLLQLSLETAERLSKIIDRILCEAKRDEQHHDFSIVFDEVRSGITIHCNSIPENTARKGLLAHCKLRQYDTKANAWYGLLLDPHTGEIRGALVYEEDWKPNLQMDAALAAWPRRLPVSISELTSGRRKIGRNDLCPCGSDRKYKRCCLGK